jgi:4-aminobutyrate aminotransferase-like enzyme
MRSWVKRYRSVMAADSAFPVVFQTASHCTVQDLDGNEYLDFISGYGVISTGWQRREIQDAIIKQVQEASFAPPWWPTREAVELAEKILSLCPKGLVACGKASSGAEANEVAVKALQAARGGKVLVVGRAYHGGSRFMLSLSDGEPFNLPPVPKTEPSVPPAYCYRCPWNLKYPSCGLACADAIDKACAADPTIQGILLEPVLGSAGVIVPPVEYFQAVQEIVRRRKLVLILDEVMTGVGRVGAFSAAEKYNIQPDAMTLAKGLSGGYMPLATAVMNQELKDGLQKYEDVSATLAWTPLGCAATMANLRLLQQERIPEHAALIGERLFKGVQELCERELPEHVGEIRGSGMMVGIEIVQDRLSRTPAPSLTRRIVLHAWRAGLMIGTSWDWRCIILMPPLTLDEGSLANGLDRFGEALARMAR